MFRPGTRQATWIAEVEAEAFRLTQPVLISFKNYMERL